MMRSFGKEKVWALLVLLLVTLGVVTSGAGARAVMLAGGGPAFSMLPLELDDLNAKLATKGFKPLNEQMFLGGGGGFGPLGDGWRIGGMGAGGRLTSKTESGQKAVLELGYGGMLVQKAIPLSNRIALTLGGLCGGGGMTLTLKSGDEPDWGGELFNESRLQQDFFLLEPMLGLEYRLSGFAALSATAGYLATFGGGDEIPGLSQLRGPVYHLGMTFGIAFDFGSALQNVIEKQILGDPENENQPKNQEEVWEQ